MGLRGAPEQPPRSLLNRTCDAFLTRLPPLRPQPSRPGLSSMAERPPSVPRLAWLAGEEEKEDKGSGAAPVWQPDEVEVVQLLQA